MNIVIWYIIIKLLSFGIIIFQTFNHILIFLCILYLHLLCLLKSYVGLFRSSSIVLFIYKYEVLIWIWIGSTHLLTKCSFYPCTTCLYPIEIRVTVFCSKINFPPSNPFPSEQIQEHISKTIGVQIYGNALSIQMLKDFNATHEVNNNTLKNYVLDNSFQTFIHLI